MRERCDGTAAGQSVRLFRAIVRVRTGWGYLTRLCRQPSGAAAKRESIRVDRLRQTIAILEGPLWQR
jgi:hypothetical protein